TQSNLTRRRSRRAAPHRRLRWARTTARESRATKDESFSRLASTLARGSTMVDLLCADARVAIELDDGQHLANPIAYRRDRRKDQLLRENGAVLNARGTPSPALDPPRARRRRRLQAAARTYRPFGPSRQRR